MNCIKCGHEKVFHLQHGCVFHNNCGCEKNAETVELLARIQELETEIGISVTELVEICHLTTSNPLGIVHQKAARMSRRLAAMLNNTPLEKE